MKMNWYEKLKYYLVAITSGLCTEDDLIDFLCDAISNNENLPYLYYDLATIKPKSLKAMQELITEGLYDKPVSDDEIFKELMELVNVRYYDKELSLKETAEVLNRLSQWFAPYSEINSLIDEYELAEKGVFYTIDDVRNKAEKLLGKRTNINIGGFA